MRFNLTKSGLIPKNHTNGTITLRFEIRYYLAKDSETNNRILGEETPHLQGADFDYKDRRDDDHSKAKRTLETERIGYQVPINKKYDPNLPDFLEAEISFSYSKPVDHNSWTNKALHTLDLIHTILVSLVIIAIVLVIFYLIRILIKRRRRARTGQGEASESVVHDAATTSEVVERLDRRIELTTQLLTKDKKASKMKRQKSKELKKSRRMAKKSKIAINSSSDSDSLDEVKYEEEQDEEQGEAQEVLEGEQDLPQPAPDGPKDVIIDEVGLGDEGSENESSSLDKVPELDLGVVQGLKFDSDTDFVEGNDEIKAESPNQDKRATKDEEKEKEKKKLESAFMKVNIDSLEGSKGADLPPPQPPLKKRQSSRRKAKEDEREEERREEDRDRLERSRRGRKSKRSRSRRYKEGGELKESKRRKKKRRKKRKRKRDEDDDSEEDEA